MLEHIISGAIDMVGDIAEELIFYLLFEKEPSEKKIEKEIDKLKYEGWFKNLYEDPNFKEYFARSESIRLFIGKKGAKRIKKKEKYQRKIKKWLDRAYTEEYRKRKI